MSSQICNAILQQAMNKYQADSLFAATEVDSRLRGNDKGVECSHIVRVAFESGVDTEFDYLVPDEFWPIETGQRVEVPFGRKNKLEVGFCVETDISHRGHREAQRKNGKKFKLKKVCRVIDKEPLLDAGLMELARWIGSYYVCPLGQVLAAMVPAAVKKGIGVKTQRYIYLASVSKKLIEQLKGSKQKLIAATLQQQNAISPDSALELQALLTELGSTVAPVKKLAEKQIIKIVQT